MKTFKEFLQEIVGSDELKKAFQKAMINNKVEAFLKDNGCNATKEDIRAFFKEQQEDRALSEEGHVCA